MKVAIIGRKNGSGLEKDMQIISDLLTAHHIQVIFRNVKKYKQLDHDVDICLFTEIVNPQYLGKRNILIPNQEWFYSGWLSDLSSFDAIFCKSRYATALFKTYHPRVYYTGFTSVDLYREMQKTPECFHSQGKSFAKGTGFVVKAWEDPSLPFLHIVTRMRPGSRSNMAVYNKLLPVDNYIALMNRCLLHVYPCQTEGFGHCLNEARSCGAVVVTTNFPPMNELISRYLLPAKQMFLLPDRLGHCATVDPVAISKLVKRIIHKEELREMGKKNRQDFLKNDIRFKEQFIAALMKI